jgi:hypothetical protein
MPLIRVLSLVTNGQLFLLAYADLQKTPLPINIELKLINNNSRKRKFKWYHQFMFEIGSEHIVSNQARTKGQKYQDYFEAWTQFNSYCSLICYEMMKGIISFQINLKRSVWEHINMYRHQHTERKTAHVRQRADLCNSNPTKCANLPSFSFANSIFHSKKWLHVINCFWIQQIPWFFTYKIWTIIWKCGA